MDNVVTTKISKVEEVVNTVRSDVKQQGDLLDKETLRTKRQEVTMSLRIKGAGLPEFVAREDLAQVVVDLANKVDVPMEKRDIAKVWRNYKRTSIIVQFNSSVMGSPMYSLRSREISGKLENLQLIILPLLTHPDEALYWKARKMVVEKKIASCFISSRQHIVMIMKDKDSKPVPVYEEADLVNF